MIFLSCYFIASLVLYLEAHKIPDLPVSYENSTGRGAKRCGTSQIHYISLGRLRDVNYLCPRCPNLCSFNCAAGYPCRSGEVGLSASFPSLLGHQSTHSLLFLGAAKNEWAVETQTQRCYSWSAGSAESLPPKTISEISLTVPWG